MLKLLFVEYTTEAEVNLRNALMLSLDKDLNFDVSTETLSQDWTLNTSYLELLRQLVTVAYLSQVVRKNLDNHSIYTTQNSRNTKNYIGFGDEETSVLGV